MHTFSNAEAHLYLILHFLSNEKVKTVIPVQILSNRNWAD